MITGKTNVVGIIGDPVKHSLSPLMHNAAFRYLNLDYVYVPFEVKKSNLEEAIFGARSLNIKGLNVTIPHKTEVIKYIDSLDTSARLIGAVNTIKFDDKTSMGYNTDGVGAIKAIEEVMKVKNKKIVILGAGGAARAVSFQMLLKDVKMLVIANRTQKNGLKLKEDLLESIDGNVKCIGLDDELKDDLRDAHILINTTPIGMYPNVNQESLVKSEMMHEDLLVNDLVYNPHKTSLLKEADKAGLRTISGIKMLIYQGIESFKIWTGVTPPFHIFEKALMEELGIDEW